MSRTASISRASHGLPAWPQRLRQAFGAYLPLVLMLMLALATWWLVKNAPKPLEERGPVVKRHEPDYSMDRFAVQRFDAKGRQRVLVEGEQLRHYPDTDTLEIDAVRIRAQGEDGRVLLATARRAVANGDATQVQLLGGAHVTTQRPGEAPAEFEGEFLHAFLDTERLRSHLPVVMRQGGTEIRARGLDYDHLSRQLRLAGPVRAQLTPRR